MNFIAHRGLWFLEEQKNTPEAFKKSFESGWGVEFDVRDYQGELVVSHDIPRGNHQTLEDFLQCYVSYPNHHELTLAVNIKADGLQDLLKAHIERFDIQNYFVFDASIPDLLGYKNKSLKFYNRVSEFEQDTVPNRDGLWFDQMVSEFATEKDLSVLVDEYVCFVSPELHKRPYLGFWETLKKFTPNPKWSLCTDYPIWAEEFFSS